MGVVAAILAGGEGKRFRPYTDILPKPMMPVGREERPILEHIVRWVSRYGVKDFVFLLGYRWRQVANYFDEGDRWGVTIRYSLDDEAYGDTGGALLKAYREGLLDGESVLVWYGDILAPLDVGELLRIHRDSGASATVVVARRYQVPVGVAEVAEDGFIRRLEEKPWLSIHATIGVLVLDPRVLGEVGESLGTRFDVMSHLIPWMLDVGKKVKAYIYDGPWYDVGSLERYQKLDPGLLEGFL